MLQGRTAELDQLAALLARARQGESSALVLRGEAGIGKSALLSETAAMATDQDFRVLRTTAAETETDLPFAALHLLLHRHTDRISALPAPQATALRTALGPAPGAGPTDGDGATSAADRFLTGLAVLTLLAELADERPLLCVVDDAHWLDHASAEALLFAGRRLAVEGVVLLFAAREGHAPQFPAPGLPELRVDGIGEEAAADLLAEHAGDLPPYVRAEILGEARGNPLALRELPAAQREGHLGVLAGPAHAVAPPHGSRVQQTFVDRVTALPEATRTLLLVAAAEGTGDLEATAAAASTLGAGVADLEPAERRQLVRLDGGRLVFGHPLIRTAAYQSAPLAARVAAHRALADALPRVGGADRRAWQLAAATTAPDEYVAAALEETARHARARGGYAAEAAAHERAARLTPDGAARARRLALAAVAAADAGQSAHAADLARHAAPHLTDPAVLARLARVRAGVAREREEFDAAHKVLLGTASEIAGRAPDTAALLLYEAMTAAWVAGHRPSIDEITDRVAALGLAPPPGAPPYLPAVDGIARLAAGEPGRALPPLRELFTRLRGDTGGLGLRERASIATWFAPLGDLEGGIELAAELERECREQGAVGPLPLVLLLRARARVLLGRHGCALAGAAEGVRIAEDSGQRHYAAQLTGVLAYLAALGGDESRVKELTSFIDPRQAPPGRVWSAAARPLLDLGLGRHEAALRGYEDLAAGPASHTTVALYCVPDHVEAAVRAGEPDSVRELAERYAAWAGHTGAPWARAIAARCRGLLAEADPARAGGDAVQAAYAEALRLHADDGRPFERARTQFLFGQWLRRAGRRSEARGPLRSALDVFEQLEAVPWAGRARAELRATGESRAPRGPEKLTAARLTPQERQVVRLAATGLSNRDIGAQLFLSPRTVGYHLYNAYPKLGVASRGDLPHLNLQAD
ncbi:helix-turn-helix transcriptional regulator [Streptomyces flavofungini]|uniref:helix-turn-helix transcriptional regulator n=1 Tax=Streptomyces flavofungini TaxID=68200 RepID=UPI0025B17A56|nr:LuxR family transcriptional regulator [Streptomyces flavofungini]WJV49755.1 AAA family ATPase [Streptomyces flavofungini]